MLGFKGKKAGSWTKRNWSSAVDKAMGAPDVGLDDAIDDTDMTDTPWNSEKIGIMTMRPWNKALDEEIWAGRGVKKAA